MQRIAFAVAAAALSLVAIACGPGTPSQSAECKAYVTCYEATGGTKGSLDSSYGTMGSCWSTTSAAADSCTSACKTALASLQSAYPDAGCKDK
jgi:hypothetical protein